VDFISDWVRITQTTGVVLARNAVVAPWGFSLERRREIGFHYLAQGEAWVRMAGHPDVRLLQGDLAFIPHGDPHSLSSASDAHVVPLETFLKRAPSARRGAASITVCGGYTFDWPSGHPLMRGLPPIVHVDAAAMRTTPALTTALALLSEELDAQRPGGEALIQPLIEALFIYAVRAWAVAGQGELQSWLSASTDEAVGRALRAIHEHPQKGWTVEALARVGALSRAAFARRFSASLGVPPLTYLLRWRMALAARYLRDRSSSIASVAEHVGYRNEFAFSRAFKRVHGVSPGQLRRGVRRGTRTNAKASFDARSAPGAGATPHGVGSR
jgi:AraC-like DNA-binding protein